MAPNLIDGWKIPDSTKLLQSCICYCTDWCRNDSEVWLLSVSQEEVEKNNSPEWWNGDFRLKVNSKQLQYIHVLTLKMKKCENKLIIIICHWPMTLFANDCFLSVARPRSPILTEPEVPVMKILSHLRSRWITAGVRLCRNKRPFRICRLQFFRMLTLIVLNRRI